MLIKHFGYYVKPGAKAVKYTVNGTSPAKAVAFTNPNGDVILVIGNTNASAFALTVKVGNEMWKATLPPNLVQYAQDRHRYHRAVQEMQAEKQCHASAEQREYPQFDAVFFAPGRGKRTGSRLNPH